jgi:hypothetical protein
VKELLEFNCVAPIKTVYSFLEQRGALGVLTDEFIETATRYLLTHPPRLLLLLRQQQQQQKKKSTFTTAIADCNF